jgi:hypothetical protein
MFIRVYYTRALFFVMGLDAGSGFGATMERLI